MNLPGFLGRLGGAAIDFLYPRRATCMGCGDMLGLDRDDLCESCRAKLARDWIGARTPKRSLKLDGAAYCYPYAGPAGGMVRNLKYGSAWVLSERMGADLARATEQLCVERLDWVASVPMHPRRLRERGRNHAELLARSASTKLGVPYGELLIRTRNAPQQARLDVAARRQNLRGGFAVPPERGEAIRGANVLLVDDVFTTGATAKNCAGALRAAGARRVFFAAYALGGGGKG